MRFMMLLKADKVTEAGVLLDAAGLQPSSKGAKVTFQNGRARVTDGPFVETKELIAGYWMIKVHSREEAIEWARRVPFDRLPSNGRVPEIELRQMYEIEDLQDVPPSVAKLEESFKAGRGGHG